MTVASIDWHGLLTVVWVSLVCGVGLTTAFGLAILGSTRAIELGRQGHLGKATLFGVLGAAGLAAVLTAIVFGIVIVAD